MNASDTDTLTNAWSDIDVESPQAVLEKALELHHPNIALASSFGLEDVALIHMLVSIKPDARIFALDTGRLNPETYECAEAIRAKYGLSIEWYFPKHDAVEELERTKGLFRLRRASKTEKTAAASVKLSR